MPCSISISYTLALSPSCYTKYVSSWVVISANGLLWFKDSPQNVTEDTSLSCFFLCGFFFASVSRKRFSNTCWNARKSTTLWKVALVYCHHLLLLPSRTKCLGWVHVFWVRFPHTVHSRVSHSSWCNVKLDLWEKKRKGFINITAHLFFFPTVLNALHEKFF